MNLPRIIWVKKSWSLKRLHLEFFKLFKNLAFRFFEKIQAGEARKSHRFKYLNAEGSKISSEEYLAMSDEEQFNLCFSKLDENNWKELMGQKAWNVEEMMYKLMVENNSSYSQDCHFCGNYHCRKHCPVPFREDMTVLDMLHKVGVEDNSSFYNYGGGKSDFILNIVWHEDFQKDWQTHLSSMVKAPILNEATANQEADDGNITI